MLGEKKKNRRLRWGKRSSKVHPVHLVDCVFPALVRLLAIFGTFSFGVHCRYVSAHCSSLTSEQQLATTRAWSGGVKEGATEIFRIGKIIGGDFLPEKIFLQPSWSVVRILSGGRKSFPRDCGLLFGIGGCSILDNGSHDADRATDMHHTELLAEKYFQRNLWHAQLSTG